MDAIHKILVPTDFSAHAEAEDRKLRKDLALEVLALKVPFRNLLVFPNQVPWPGRLRTLHSLKILDAGRTREIQTNYDRLPHICSR